MTDNNSPGLTIDEIHSLLDFGDEVRTRLEHAQTPTIELEDYWELYELVMGIVGYGPIYPDNPLGIQPSILNKLKKFIGPFDRKVAMMIADRSISFLKSLDQAWEADVEENSADAPVQSELLPTAFGFRGERWIALAHAPAVAKKIAHVSVLLDSIIQNANHSNLPPGEQLLTEIERKQLIAILETALALLKSPMVERGLFERAGDALKDSAKKAAEKQTEEGLGKLFELASRNIFDLIKLLF